MATVGLKTQKSELEEAHQVENYCFEEFYTPEQIRQYDSLVEQAYRSVGFLDEKILPRQNTQRYGVTLRGGLVGICSLTPVTDENNVFVDVFPEFRKKRLIELGNVILQPEYRGSVSLGVILYESAKRAWQGNYDYIVGITRFRVLRHFVDFGVVPLLHKPLHLLGKEDLLDFIIYYNTHSPDSIQYMEERAKRYFHQEYILAAIRERYIHQGNSKAESYCAGLPDLQDQGSQNRNSKEVT